MTLGGHKPAHNVDQTIESKSTYIPPRDGDTAALVDDRSQPIAEKANQDCRRESQSPHVSGFKHLNHLTRIKIFEQEKKRKIEAAK